MADVKILLVEDESIKSIDTKRTLESFGYIVPYVASSGEDAFAKSLDIMPDLILIEIVITGNIDGIDVASKIKDLNVPVIYITAHSEKSTIEIAKLIEPYGYIIKPYNRTELKNAIKFSIYKNRMEKELKESEENFRAIAENSIDAILIAVESEKYVYVNTKAVELTGYSKEELLNTHIEDIAHPDEKIKFKEKIRAKDSRKTYPPTFETLIIRKDNEIVPIEISAVNTTWKNQPAVMVQLHDITKRKIAEISLKKSAERFRAVAESAIDAIVTTDENGKIICFNNSLTKIFGYTKEEITGKPLTILMPTRYQKKYLTALQNFKESGKHRIIGKTVTTIGVKKDKSEFPFEMSLSAWKSEQKTYFTSIIRNLSERQKAKKKLAEQAVMLANINDAVIGTDVNYLINYWNKSAEKMYGYSEKEILGQYSGILKPEFFSLTNDEALKQLEATGNLNVELIHTTKDGRKIIVDSRNQILFDEFGNRYGMIGINRDITERKKADEKIKLASLYNRSLIEASLDPLVTIGPDGKIIDVNNATGMVTGFSRDELIGSDFSNYFTEPLKAKMGYLQVFKEGFVLDYPLEIQHKDGHVTPVLYNASVYRDESGEVVGVFAAARDITELKKAEKAIIQAKEEWENTFDAVPDLIAILNTEYKVVRANKSMADRLGIKTEEAVGLTCYNVVHGLNLPPSVCPYNKLLEDGHEHTIEVHEKNLGGDFIVSVSPLYDTKGKISGAVHVARDITKRKLVEDEIKRSLEEKDILLREIHHRVKNNLQIISSLLNLQESTENEEVTDILKESMGRVKTMATIHEKLYESPSLNEINFKQFTEKLLYNILYTYGIPNGTIKTELSMEDIKFNIDTTMPLGLIINELVTNTVKYAFPKNEGTITIKLKSILNKFELIIADNGIGIPIDIDPTNTKTLGLKLVQNLLNQLEGKLDLDVNNGTKFKITFKELKYKKRL